jgi:hypothetical protein
MAARYLAYPRAGYGKAVAPGPLRRDGGSVRDHLGGTMVDWHSNDTFTLDFPSALMVPQGTGHR